MCKRIFAVLLAVTLMCCTAAAVYADDSSVTLYGFSFTINNDGKAVIHSYDDRSSDVVIPKALLRADVEAIDDYAFFNDTKITSVSFDNATGLRRIGTDAFYGCQNLTSLRLPSGVDTIGFGAFQACGGLENIELGDAVTEIPGQCFYGCGKLDDVVVPAGAESVGNMAFSSCVTLSDIEIPDSVTQIADNAFKNSNNVTIYCKENSYAHSYAVEHNINVKFVERLRKGDVNQDYSLNISDATVIQKYKAGINTLSKRSQKLGDVNNDGSLSIRDATRIQMRIAGIINNF